MKTVSLYINSKRKLHTKPGPTAESPQLAYAPKAVYASKAVPVLKKYSQG